MIQNTSNKQNQLEEQLDLIATTVVDNSDRLDKVEEKLKTVVTKEDHQEVMNTLDVLVKLAKKKDEELTMMSHAIRRQGKEIDQIKPLVGLA